MQILYLELTDMKVIKRFGMLMLAALFCILLCGCNKGGPDLIFAHTEDGSGYNVVECKGYNKNVIIPSEHNGLPVVGIGDKAFANLKIERVVIPESIEYIGKSAFSGCTKLLDINIPNRVKVIDDEAFANCLYLRYITIGATLESIGKNVFENCPRIIDITVDESNATFFSKDNCLINRDTKTLVLGCSVSVIPMDGSVTIIGYGAFNGCTFLKTITLYEQIEKIEAYAFKGTGLEKVYISSTVTEIGELAFDNTNIDVVYYEGTREMWNAISVYNYQYLFGDATVYCDSVIKK